MCVGGDEGGAVWGELAVDAVHLLTHFVVAGCEDGFVDGGDEG